MSLSEEPIRPLKSREIAFIISSLLGGLSQFCDIEEIYEALDHFCRNKDEYKKQLKIIKEGLGKITNDYGELKIV